MEYIRKWVAGGYILIFLLIGIIVYVWSYEWHKVEHLELENQKMNAFRQEIHHANICTMELSLAWDLSDTFNGLMMIPNLIGVLALSPIVAKITANYVRRTFMGSDEKPMYSAFDDIQKMHEEAPDVED